MKRWLITGISSGIGEALAHAVLAQGDTVIGTVRDPNAVKAFESHAPGRSIGLLMDVSRHDEIPSAVGQALAGGPIDILVNNAGRSLFGAFEETSLDEIKALLDVNLFGPWVLTQAILPHFRQRGGGIVVQMSSGCGVTGVPGVSAYCCSKFALEGFTEALATEVAAFGIKVMLVEPGAVATRFISVGTQETKRRMPDYAFLSGQGKGALDAYYAELASPPEVVAKAIVDALQQPVIPSRLVVGDDVRASIKAKAQQLSDAAGS